MSEKNGGPAFPVDTRSTSIDAESGEFGHQTSINTWQFPGMTLRDYFAAKAMKVVAKNVPTPLSNIDSVEHWRNSIASSSYRLADAMLRAREVKP